MASVCQEYGLKPALDVLDLPKSTWYYHQQQKVPYDEKYQHLIPLLEEIARQHPEYGYRRTTVELHETYDEPVNHKVVKRLHQLWGLVVLRQARPPWPSGIRQGS